MGEWDLSDLDVLPGGKRFCPGLLAEGLGRAGTGWLGGSSGAFFLCQGQCN